MLAVIGFATILTFLILTTFTKKVSVPVALILVPVFFAIVGGFAGTLGPMVSEGLLKVAPVAIMIAFAILYFSLMVDVGLFDPVLRRILSWAGNSPTKIAVGTAIITLCVALDGDGTSTFLITITALLPVYQRIGMRPVVLTGIVCLAAGMMNIIPWGGPTARAMAVLNLTSDELFIPLLPAMAAGAVWVIAVAWFLGRRETRRIGALSLPDSAENISVTGTSRAKPGSGVTTQTRESTVVAIAPPVLVVNRWVQTFNAVLTLILLATLLLQLVPLHLAFPVAFALAAAVNLPQWSQQQELLKRHGSNVALVVTMVLAAGVLTGFLTGSGAITAIAETMVSWIPDSAAPLMPLLTALTAMPLTLVMTADAYYFGVVPILAETTAAFGGDPAEIGRAALLGHSTTGFPLSPLIPATFILLGLSGVDLVKHQRYIFGWAFGTTAVMTVAALLTGAISI